MSMLDLKLVSKSPFYNYELPCVVTLSDKHSSEHRGPSEPRKTRQFLVLTIEESRVTGRWLDVPQLWKSCIYHNDISDYAIESIEPIAHTNLVMKRKYPQGTLFRVEYNFGKTYHVHKSMIVTEFANSVSVSCYNNPHFVNIDPGDHVKLTYFNINTQEIETSTGVLSSNCHNTITLVSPPDNADEPPQRLFISLRATVSVEIPGTKKCTALQPGYLKLKEIKVRYINNVEGVLRNTDGNFNTYRYIILHVLTPLPIERRSPMADLNPSLVYCVKYKKGDSVVTSTVITQKQTIRPDCYCFTPQANFVRVSVSDKLEPTIYIEPKNLVSITALQDLSDMDINQHLSVLDGCDKIITIRYTNSDNKLGILVGRCHIANGCLKSNIGDYTVKLPYVLYLLAKTERQTRSGIPMDEMRECILFM